MSYDYTYARALLGSGQWDIDNPNRVDGGGAQIHLVKEIEAALPIITFTLRCDGAVLTICCDNPLTAGEEATITGLVSSHKANA